MGQGSRFRLGAAGFLLTITRAMSKILVVEDEADLARALAINLRKEGHEVRSTCHVGMEHLMRRCGRTPN